MRSLSLMQNFRDITYELELEELLSKVSWFTWINKIKDIDVILEKLHMFLVNRVWTDLYLIMEVVALEFYGYDHRELKLSFNFQPRPHVIPSSLCFMFEIKWLVEDDFMEVVEESWNSGNQDLNFISRIKNYSSALHPWLKVKVGSTRKRIKKTRAKLNSALDRAEHEWDKDEVHAIEVELEKLETQEELHWKQHSRVN